MRRGALYLCGLAAAVLPAFAAAQPATPAFQNPQLPAEERTADLVSRMTLEEKARQVHATGKPVVLVLMNGSAMSVNWADQNVPAIVEAWYPGGSGGHAVAQLLAGDFSPAGRLPVTFYKSADQLPPFNDYSMKNRTYRYFDARCSTRSATASATPASLTPTRGSVRRRRPRTEQ